MILFVSSANLELSKKELTALSSSEIIFVANNKIGTNRFIYFF